VSCVAIDLSFGNLANHNLGDTYGRERPVHGAADELRAPDEPRVRVRRRDVRERLPAPACWRGASGNGRVCGQHLHTQCELRDGRAVRAAGRRVCDGHLAWRVHRELSRLQPDAAAGLRLRWSYVWQRLRTAGRCRREVGGRRVLEQRLSSERAAGWDELHHARAGVHLRDHERAEHRLCAAKRVREQQRVARTGHELPC